MAHNSASDRRCQSRRVVGLDGWREAGRESEEGVLLVAGEHGGWKARRERERTLLGVDDDEDEEEWVMTHSFMMICAAAREDERTKTKGGRKERKGKQAEAIGSRLSGETNVGSGCGCHALVHRPAIRPACCPF